MMGALAHKLFYSLLLNKMHLRKTALSPCQLTWNYFKKVTSRLVLIGRQLIDPAALERNTTLFKKDKERDRVTDRHEENTCIKDMRGPNNESIRGPGPRCGAHANTVAV